ncbi:hypothetical protein ZWY2020_041535 [Hordeum vulgare]|nr:hypothetical protein ZWY2020_041535 [Hordeum vulgare]
MLRNVIFPNYGGSPLIEDDFDEKKMLMEKPRLKDELDRVPIRTYKSLDRPFVQISLAIGGRCATCSCMKIHGTGAATRGQGPVRVDAGEEDALESIARELGAGASRMPEVKLPARQPDPCLMGHSVWVTRIGWREDFETEGGKADPAVALLKDGRAKTSHADPLEHRRAHVEHGEYRRSQALVYAAMAYGHKLVERTSGHIIVAVFGTRQRNNGVFVFVGHSTNVPTPPTRCSTPISVVTTVWRPVKLSFGSRVDAQHEGLDNRFLHVENHKILCQNIALRKMLRNVIFPNYGGSPLVEDDFDVKKMLMEKPRLKDELDRVPIRTYKSLDRPFVQISCYAAAHNGWWCTCIDKPTIDRSSEETDICGVPSGIGMNGWSRDLEVGHRRAMCDVFLHENPWHWSCNARAGPPDGVILRPKTAVKTDPKLTALLKDGTGAKTSHARDLFLALATCNTIVPIVEHTVNPAAKLVEYQGESHDEQALVYAAMAYGHKLVERTSGHIVVAVFGTRQRYEHTTPPIRHDAPALASCLCDKLTM